MRDPISIASVTIAYNGAKLLPDHLDALRRQNRKLDEIIVVDNASTDDTASFLADRYPEVTVLSSPANGGVGGGYAAGLQYAALSKKYDWIWLFDQDSLPQEDTLERLLTGLQHLEHEAANTAVLAPICVDQESGLPCPGLTWKGDRFWPTQIPQGQSIILADSVISSGSLIRREAIETAGLPRADFFMDFVDHEHCFRLRRHGFKIAIIPDSHLHHVLGKPNQQKLLGRRKYWTDHPPWRHYYMARNQVYTIWHDYPGWKTKAFVLYRLARFAADVILLGKQKGSCLKMMFRGVIDGRAARLGIRFLPDSVADSKDRFQDIDQNRELGVGAKGRI